MAAAAVALFGVWLGSISFEHPEQLLPFRAFLVESRLFLVPLDPPPGSVRRRHDHMIGRVVYALARPVFDPSFAGQFYWVTGGMGFIVFIFDVMTIWRGRPGF